MIEKQPEVSFAEFITWEHGQAHLHELIGGRIVPFRAGSLDHESITVNIIAKLKVTLEPPCKVFPSTAIIRTISRTRENGYRPDATVSCLAGNIGTGMYVEDPRIVVEVVSPSNSGREWNEKLFEYANTPSIEQLILIESLERHVTSYVRDSSGIWQRPVYLTDGALDFTPVRITMKFGNIYENTSLA